MRRLVLSRGTRPSSNSRRRDRGQASSGSSSRRVLIGVLSTHRRPARHSRAAGTHSSIRRGIEVPPTVDRHGAAPQSPPTHHADAVETHACRRVAAVRRPAADAALITPRMSARAVLSLLIRVRASPPRLVRCDGPIHPSPHPVARPLCARGHADPVPRQGRTSTHLVTSAHRGDLTLGRVPALVTSSRISSRGTYRHRRLSPLSSSPRSLGRPGPPERHAQATSADRRLPRGPAARRPHAPSPAHPIRLSITPLLRNHPNLALSDSRLSRRRP